MSEGQEEEESRDGWREGWREGTCMYMYCYSGSQEDTYACMCIQWVPLNIIPTVQGHYVGYSTIRVSLKSI